VYILFQEGFAEGNEAYFPHLLPVKGFKMTGVGEVDGAGYGAEHLIVCSILPGPVFYKNKGEEIGPVYRRSVGQGIVYIFQIVHGEIGLSIDLIEWQAQVHVLIIQLIKNQFFCCFFHGNTNIHMMGQDAKYRA
jgi:hypothetical protein